VLGWGLKECQDLFFFLSLFGLGLWVVLRLDSLAHAIDLCFGGVANW
jgi:hypothetical protein